VLSGGHGPHFGGAHGPEWARTRPRYARRVGTHAPALGLPLAQAVAVARPLRDGAWEG